MFTCIMYSDIILYMISQAKIKANRRWRYSLAGQLYQKKYNEMTKPKRLKYYQDRRDHFLELTKKYRYTVEGKYAAYKAKAKRKKIHFDLSLDYFRNFWKKPCYYCGGEIKTIGLDRINNNNGYEKNNIVSCCSICNFMKKDLSNDIFIGHIEKIAKYQKK